MSNGVKQVIGEVKEKQPLADNMKLQIIKTTNSMHLTVPKHWRDLYDLEEGDYLDLTLNHIFQKARKKEK